MEGNNKSLQLTCINTEFSVARCLSCTVASYASVGATILRLSIQQSERATCTTLDYFCVLIGWDFLVILQKTKYAFYCSKYKLRFIVFPSQNNYISMHCYYFFSYNTLNHWMSGVGWPVIIAENVTAWPGRTVRFSMATCTAGGSMKINYGLTNFSGDNFSLKLFKKHIQSLPVSNSSVFE